MSIIERYQQVQHNTSLRNFDLQYLTIGFSGEVGEVCNEVKKLVRDDDGVLTNERRRKMIDEMGDVMWYFMGMVRVLDTSMEEILENNMAKCINKSS